MHSHAQYNKMQPTLKAELKLKSQTKSQDSKSPRTKLERV